MIDFSLFCPLYWHLSDIASQLSGYIYLGWRKSFCFNFRWRAMKMGQLKWKIINNDNSSLIKQNGGSQNGCYKKTKDATFSLKQTFLTPDTHTYVRISGAKKCSFYRNSEHAFVIVSGTTRRIDIKIPLFGPHAEKFNHGTMIKTGITCNKIIVICTTQPTDGLLL